MLQTFFWTFTLAVSRDEKDMLALSTQTCIMGLPPPKSRNRQIFYEGLENLVRQVVGRTTSVIEIVPSTHQPFCLCTFSNLSCPASSDSFSFLQKRNLNVSGLFFFFDFPPPLFEVSQACCFRSHWQCGFSITAPTFFFWTLFHTCVGVGVASPPPAASVRKSQPLGACHCLSLEFIQHKQMPQDG